MKLFLVATLFSIVGIGALSLFAQQKGSLPINRDTLRQAMVIDVRSNDEFSQGHYAGAVNIPLQELESKVPELKRCQRPIVIVCRSGNRAGKAVELLKSKGIPSINGVNQATLEKIK